MPDSSPALIDTIARAIFDTYVDLAQRDGYGGKDLIATLMTDYGSCLNAARAALAAMPQPIGYGVKTGNVGWYGPHQSLPQAQKVAADLYGGNVTVVALVPVEDQ